MASIWKRDQSRYWYGCYTDAAGKQRKRSTKRDDAMTIAMEWERVARLARDGNLTQVQCRKVLSEILEKTTGESIRHTSTEDFFAEWIKSKEAARAEKTAVRYATTRKLFIEHLGPKAKKPLDAISTSDVQSFLNSRLAGGAAPKTVKVDAKTLSSAFGRAHTLGLILTNPAKAVELPKVTSSKRTTFTHAQIWMLIEAVPSQEWKTVILLGYYTGARLSDCAAMRWENVNFKDGVLEFEPEKTAGEGDNKVVVPMHEDLEQHLSKLASSDRPEERLCPGLVGKNTGGAHGLSATFKTIMRNAGIDSQMGKGKGKRQFSKLSFHSLRHSFNSALANAGVSQETRMKLTGHKTAAVNEGYTHHDAKRLKEAIRKLPTMAEAEQLSLGLQ